ncbi:ferritin-like domain-containing protein [Trametes polyzona]|nr:ferritin-like domain-containing protein [Trametes polyzona]
MFHKAALVALVGVATAANAIQTPTWCSKELVQFALNVENLESAFLSQGLSQFSVTDFTNAGYAKWVRGRFQQIADNEAAHVAFLSNAVGTDDAPKACTYDFPITDVQSFVNLAQKIETIGASAYIGLGGYLDNSTAIGSSSLRGAITAAVSIAATKARQAGWITATVLHQQPWDGAFETPLSPVAAWSLLTNFVNECPDSNPDVGVPELPTLTISDSTPAPGDTISLTIALKGAKSPRYAIWLDGIRTVYSEITNGKTVVPSGLSGTVFVGVVPSKDAADRDNLITGFAVVDFPFDSNARNVL